LYPLPFINSEAYFIMTPEISIEAEFSWLNLIWTSFSEVIWFSAGFVLFRLALWAGIFPSKVGPSFKKAKGGASKSTSEPAESPLSKAIRRHGAQGDLKSAQALWHEADKETATLSGAAVQVVTQALLNFEPASLAEELVEYFSKSRLSATAGSVHSAIGVLLRGGRVDLAKDLLDHLQAEKLQSSVPSRSVEAVVGAFASHADVPSVNCLLAAWDEFWGSAANTAVRGFVKSQQPDLALKQFQELQQRAEVQPATVTELFNLTSSTISVPQLLQNLKGVSIPSEPVAALMSTCLKKEDAETAKAVAEFFREQDLPLVFSVMEPLLKLTAKKDEAWAMALFQEMQLKTMFLSEGLCGSVLSSCGEAGHIKLGEAIQKYLRDRKMTTLATYKTWMKVYASCDMLDRACDLYDDILADGVKPDSVMIGCLIKFALKSGRSELCQRLQSEGGYDSHNAISLIRLAGQQGDLDQALRLLQDQESKGAVVAAVYNSVLDVVLAKGSESQVQQILEKMRSQKQVTLVTFNTLMKGYCAKNNFQRAHSLIREITECGLTPDSTSYNCLMSAAVSQGDHSSAWTVFDDMRRAAIEPDNFTLSIVMKMVRKTSNPKEVQRGMAVFDNCSFDICNDEVLINTVLDACIHLRDLPRLRWTMAEIQRTKMKPSVQNYGLIIKAYACLKDTDKCCSLWKQMTQERGLTPTDVAFSCMLDALVSAGKVEDAVALFKEWRGVVPPNTIIFSNLIKGFAARGDAEGAMMIFEELKAEGLQMNLVAYSTLIDAQAKAGNVEKARELLEEMKKDGVKPNTITYSSLLKGHCMKGDMDQGLKVLEEMMSSGLKPDTVMFNTLLDGAVRCNRFSLCDQLLEEMKGSGMEASNFTTSIVVKMWGRRKRLDKAVQAVIAASEEGKQQLDSKLCTCLLSACFHNNSPMRALELLKDMKAWANCDGPDASTYEQVIEGLIRAKLVKEAVEIAMEASQLAAIDTSRRSLKVPVLQHLRDSLKQKHAEHIWAPLENYLQRHQLPHP